MKLFSPKFQSCVHINILGIQRHVLHGRTAGCWLIYWPLLCNFLIMIWSLKLLWACIQSNLQSSSVCPFYVVAEPRNISPVRTTATSKSEQAKIHTAECLTWPLQTELLKIHIPPPSPQQKWAIMRLRNDWREKMAVALPQVVLSFFSENLFPTHYSQERRLISDNLPAEASLFKIIIL